MSMNGVYYALTACEIGFNLGGYIPVVGHAAAHGRRYFAAGQVVLGVGLAMMAIGLKVLGDRSTASDRLLEGCVTVWIHAGLNVGRSLIENIPIGGNLACGTYDLMCLIAKQRLLNYPIV